MVEMDEIFLEAWAPIFRMYVTKPEPDWEPFLKKYEHAIPPPTPMEAEPHTDERLGKHLKRTSKHRAAGLDGWRMAELIALPLLAGAASRFA